VVAHRRRPREATERRGRPTLRVPELAWRRAPGGGAQGAASARRQSAGVDNAQAGGQRGLCKTEGDSRDARSDHWGRKGGEKTKKLVSLVNKLLNHCE
jgi:hypothetical protein